MIKESQIRGIFDGMGSVSALRSVLRITWKSCMGAFQFKWAYLRLIISSWMSAQLTALHRMCIKESVVMAENWLALYLAGISLRAATFDWAR